MLRVDGFTTRRWGNPVKRIADATRSELAGSFFSPSLECRTSNRQAANNNFKVIGWIKTRSNSSLPLQKLSSYYSNIIFHYWLFPETKYSTDFGYRSFQRPIALQSFTSYIKSNRYTLVEKKFHVCSQL